MVVTKRRKRKLPNGQINARYGPPNITLPPDYRANRIITWRVVGFFVFCVAIMSFLTTEATVSLFHWSRVFKDWQYSAHVYYPWAIYQWMYAFADHHVRGELKNEVAIAWIYVAVAAIVTLAATVDASRRIKNHVERPYDTEGSSHWMIPKEMDATGFIDTDPAIPAIYIGEWTDPRTGKRKWLRDTRDTHVLMLAPTRAGKGVSVIIPTLLTWSGSVVVNDPKGENYELTARARMNMGQYALKHDPVCTDGSAAKFNILDEIRKGTVYDTKDAMLVSLGLVDPLGMGLETGGDSDHWRSVAWSFLTGAELHIIYAPHRTNKTLNGLDAFIDSGTMTEDEVLEEMLTTEHDPGYRYGWLNEKGQLTKTHPIVAAAARAMINRPPAERGSAMSSARKYTQLYKDQIIADNTSRSDFSIDDIMQNPKGVSLYLINTPEDMIRVRGHMRMMVNLINSRFTGKVTFDWSNGARGRQKKNYAKPLLFLQDEFTSTHGKLDTFANALAFHAGYGIRCLIVAQDYSQLEGTYGDAGAQAIVSNMHSNIYYTSTNDKTAQRIENMLGSMTFYDESISKTKGVVTRSQQFKKRPLIYSSEFMRMDEDDGIAVVAGKTPIYIQKIRHYNEDAFMNLIAQPPAISDSIPIDDRAMNKRLAILQAENEKRIRARKESANGFAPPNIMPGKEDVPVSSADMNGNDTALYNGPAAFDGSGPTPVFVSPRPIIKDRLDRGLDANALDQFADIDEEVFV